MLQCQELSHYSFHLDAKKIHSMVTVREGMICCNYISSWTWILKPKLFSLWLKCTRYDYVKSISYKFSSWLWWNVFKNFSWKVIIGLHIITACAIFWISRRYRYIMSCNLCFSVHEITFCHRSLFGTILCVTMAVRFLKFNSIS